LGLTRVDADTIQYEATVNDPKIWVRSWKVAIPLKRRPDYGMFEYACHEGNYAMGNILSGAQLGRQERSQSREVGRSFSPDRFPAFWPA
jgi:hypothetical protein